MTIEATANDRGDGRQAADYARLEERILARDQGGASDVYYDLVRAGRPLEEMLLEAVRIHGPYTHVPYHERIDDGFVNFVNNDHCLLSARATLHLTKMLPPELAALPMAQTIWYIPTGLDIWNQKILQAPGHYARGYKLPEGTPPPVPVVHWPDQEPVYETGTYQERLEHWLTQVHRGDVLPAYRVFLGLMEDTENRSRLLAELVFAGLIDVQDRMLYNRSYTTGHKSYRARATIELGQAIGWDDAHPVVYAGALDIAVGPRWYSTYEMACNAITVFIEDEVVQAIPYRGTTEREEELLRNTEPLSDAEAAAFVDALIREPEPGYIEHLAKLLLAGKSPRHLIDVIQIAAAEVVLETGQPMNFSMSQHCYEYCNTMRWFLDNFQHRQQIKLLFVAAGFLNRVAQHQANTSGNGPTEIAPPGEAAKMSSEQILARIEDALLAFDPQESVNWTQAYLDDGHDRSVLVQTLAATACKIGNDPHNQEIAQCLLEDYGRSTSPKRERLLLTSAHHTAGHRKYGDPLTAYRRYAEAFEIAH